MRERPSEFNVLFCEGDPESGTREAARARETSVVALADAPVASEPLSVAGAFPAFASVSSAGALDALPPPATFIFLCVLFQRRFRPLCLCSRLHNLLYAAVAAVGSRARSCGTRALLSAARPAIAHAEYVEARRGPSPWPPPSSVPQFRFQLQSLSSLPRVTYFSLHYARTHI